MSNTIENLISQICTSVVHKGNTELTKEEFNQLIPDGFELVEEWSTPYRWVWDCDQQKTIIHYVEGDISIEQYKTEAAYRKGLDRCDEAYLESSTEEDSSGEREF